jgi:hypothetical protein
MNLDREYWSGLSTNHKRLQAERDQLRAELAETKKQRDDCFNQVADVNAALLRRNAPRPCGECNHFYKNECPLLSCDIWPSLDLGPGCWEKKTKLQDPTTYNE